MNFESFSFSESPRHTCMAEAKIQDAETAKKEKPRTKAHYFVRLLILLPL